MPPAKCVIRAHCKSSGSITRGRDRPRPRRVAHRFRPYLTRRDRWTGTRRARQSALKRFPPCSLNKAGTIDANRDEEAKRTPLATSFQARVARAMNGRPRMLRTHRTVIALVNPVPNGGEPPHMEARPRGLPRRRNRGEAARYELLKCEPCGHCCAGPVRWILQRELTGWALVFRDPRSSRHDRPGSGLILRACQGRRQLEERRHRFGPGDQ